MIVFYSLTLKPYAWIALHATVDDFGNEIGLSDFADPWMAFWGAMNFVPVEHTVQLCGEH